MKPVKSGFIRKTILVMVIAWLFYLIIYPEARFAFDWRANAKWFLLGGVLYAVITFLANRTKRDE